MKLTGLPFTKSRTNGTIDAWAPTATGDYAADCAFGNNYFDQLRFHVQSNPLTLSHVLQAMIEKGQVTGVEIGFLHSMSMAVAAGENRNADTASAEAA